ncbi:MAG TPA: YMGG-like glycine zipper-containing protein [Pyrinomonadaceae bacterium]|nr:YMGG-like glycine zipper-containing protein [Pyrinomonadaceae bacterium]
MKKYILGFLFAVLIIGAITVITPTSVPAQTRYVARVVDRNGRVRWVPVSSPSYYRRHRNAINMAVGTGAGALIGGLIGGKKGALIGGGVGLGTSALYSYKINKNKRVYRRVTNY